MFIGPHEIARRMEHKHHPWWLVWYGRSTRQYWAMARWVRTPGAMLGASVPDALDAAIATFETHHPPPRRNLTMPAAGGRVERTLGGHRSPGG
jgi:hypothetical protein